MRTREEVEREMREVSAELATITYYVNGSISERPRRYRRRGGGESEQKALPTLQYYAGGRQGGKRVPRALLPAMRRRVANGKRRKELLRRLDALAAELTLIEIGEGAAKKNSAPFTAGELAFLWELLEAALAPAPGGLADTDRRILDAVTGFGRAVCERRLNAAARARARGRSGFRKRTVLSLLGPLGVRRPYFAPDPRARRAPGAGRAARNADCPRRGGAPCASPFDARAGFSDGMTRTLAWLVQRAGVVCGSFGEGAGLLGEFTAARMSESTFRLKVLAAGRRAEADQGRDGLRFDLEPRYTPAQIASSVPCPPTLYGFMDGCGVPCVRADLREARDGDGPAKTREMKSGVIGIYSRYDEKRHRPVRAPGCEIHVATADGAAGFAAMFRNAAVAAGYGRAGGLRAVWGGDGAAWIAAAVAGCFHAGVGGEHQTGDEFFVNDYFHAAEHLHALVSELAPAPDAPAEFGRLKDLLWRTGAEEACADVVKTYGLPAEGSEARKHYDYLWGRRPFMRYGEFRRLQLFIGTGIIEAACRTDIARRCKQSGMHWRVFNASAMCALVARIRSRRMAA